MLELPRLTIIRQRRIAQGLTEAAQDKIFVKTLAVDVRDALAKAAQAGEALGVSHDLPPLLVDNSTDTVFGAFDGVVSGIERGMTDRVIAPLPPAQAKKKAAAALLRQRVFPNGTDFLSRSMPLQYSAMVTIIDTLRNDTACAAAVAELVLGYFVDHMEAHLAPYGRSVKTTDNRDLEAAGTAFHDAYVRLVVKLAAHHEGAGAIQERLYNPFQNEITAQREEERSARRARKKAAAKPA